LAATVNSLAGEINAEHAPDAQIGSTARSASAFAGRRPMNGSVTSEQEKENDYAT
jgi:hypothetical protein